MRKRREKKNDKRNLHWLPQRAGTGEMLGRPFVVTFGVFVRHRSYLCRLQSSCGFVFVCNWSARDAIATGDQFLSPFYLSQFPSLLCDSTVHSQLSLYACKIRMINNNNVFALIQMYHRFMCSTRRWRQPAIQRCCWRVRSNCRRTHSSSSSA